jgi:hypothetical protein
MSSNSRKFSRLAGALGAAALVFGATAAHAGNVGVDLNLHLGDQPRQVIVREPVAPPPAQVVTIEEDIDFIYPDRLGFYVAVGVPYDLFYVSNNYYLFRDGRWLRASRDRGPWVVIPRRDLPPGLRKHRIERIRDYRASEYEIYRRDRDHYHGRRFHAGKEEWKEHRKWEKEERKEMKREEKERRKEDKWAEKEERREHKRGKHHDD